MHLFPKLSVIHESADNSQYAKYDWTFRIFTIREKWISGYLIDTIHVAIHTLTYSFAMSRFYVLRKICKLTKNRQDLCVKKYEEFVCDLLKGDMGDVILPAYNQDVYGVEVVRCTHFSLLDFN